LFPIGARVAGQQDFDRLEPRAHARRCLVLQGTVLLNDLATEPRQGSPAAAATSELGFHKRLAKKPVEFGDQ
jgi:hypothetical protein